MSTFTPQEKSRIFVERTMDLWPQNWENYLELVKHETWSEEELYNYNFNQRIQVLKFAYENTTFYKRLYDYAGLQPGDVKSESDWEKVPVVTKQMIADNSKEFEVNDSIDKYGFVANTGGSTGKPLRVFRDRRHFWQAPFWRFYGWHMGRKCGQVGLEYPIWGMDEAHIDREQYRFTSEELTKRAQAFWPIEYYYLSPYSEFIGNVSAFISEVSKSPMTRGYVYAGGLEMFLDYCLQGGYSLHNFAFIDACASPLTNVIRNKASQIFGCRVFDLYASNEMGPMAAECCCSGNEHNLHVLSDLLHLELLSDDGMPVQGEEIGTTVITSFTNRVFPFVRYNHGDRTHFIKNKCKCGLKFPCIAPVRGRVSDYLTTVEGVRLDGVGFNEVFDFYPDAVRQFQFRQSQNGLATLVVVKNNSYKNSEEEINKVFDKLQIDFKEKIKFKLKYTDNISSEGGKTRYIVHE